jgi:hypothetical protein
MTKKNPAYFVSVLRHAGYPDCSMNGVTARYDNADLYRSAADLPDELPEGRAILVLEDSPKAGPEPYLRAVPAGERRWTMFGGNFIWSSDSRFRREVSERPIPVHDRIEG